AHDDVVITWIVQNRIALGVDANLNAARSGAERVEVRLRVKVIVEVDDHGLLNSERSEESTEAPRRSFLAAPRLIPRCARNWLNAARSGAERVEVRLRVKVIVEVDDHGVPVPAPGARVAW